MPLRISTHAVYDSLLNTVLGAQSRINRLQQTIADGRQLRVPSDDPIGTHRAMQARENIATIQQFQVGLEQGLDHLDASDATLTQLEDVLSTSRALQTSAANDAEGIEERAAMAEQIDQLLRQAVDLGNQTFSGVYLFGGRDTLTTPFQVVEDAEGKVAEVTISAGAADPNGAVQRQVDRDVLLSIHPRASDVFGDEQEFFHALIDLRDAMKANDVAAITALRPRLEAAEERLLSAHGAVGSLEQRGTILRDQLARDALSHEGERTEIEDADVAETLVALQQQEVALRAALAGGARILNLSLLDYLS